MMSSHGANPNFFNKKKTKIGRPEHSLTPHPLTSDNISFFLYPVLLLLKVDVICVSSLSIDIDACKFDHYLNSPNC